MDQTTPPPVSQPARRRLAPILAFWAIALLLVGARVALFDEIRPGAAAPGSVVLAAR